SRADERRSLGYIGPPSGRQHHGANLAFRPRLPHKRPAMWEVRMDSLAARNRMVDGQVRPSDVTDFRILEAMLAIPRERFVPADQVDLAYADFEVPVASGSSNSPRRLLGPRTLAKLIQAAMIRPGDTALVVACATGYGAAVVARLANHVVALDEDAALVAFAGQALGAVGIRNATTANGPLTAGWPPRG